MNEPGTHQDAGVNIGDTMLLGLMIMMSVYGFTGWFKVDHAGRKLIRVTVVARLGTYP